MKKWIAIVCIGMLATAVQAQIVGGGGVKSFDNDPSIIAGIALTRTLFAADGDFLVGTGNDTLATENGGTARTSMGVAIGTDVQAHDDDLDKLALNDAGSVTNIGDAAINADSITAAKMATAVQTSLGKADTALQPITQVSGVSTSGLVATVTYQSSIAGVQHLTGWLSEAAGGVAVGTNCSSMVGADSTTVLAGGGDTIAYAVWSSKADGLSTLTVTTKALQTGLYFNTVQSDGVVVSTPAFDVAP